MDNVKTVVADIHNGEQKKDVFLSWNENDVF